MRKLHRFGSFISASALLCVLMVLMVGPVSAHPAVSSAPLAGCNTVEVTLHGTASPTSACLDKPSGSVIPLTISRTCIGDGSDLILYWNGPIDVAHGVYPPGPKLCIRGQGSLDLTGTQPDGRNWNDQASAWWAGCSDGEFWLNTGFNWPWQGSTFSGGNASFAPSGNFPYGNVGNDQLSKVELYSNC